MPAFTNRTRLRARAASTSLAFVLAACPAARTTMPEPSPSGAGYLVTSPALPPVPLVAGPLALRVVYPRPNALIQSRDSNFIFGSVGDGRATLTINGARVPVYPNGAFLAFLPLPPPDAARYELVAATTTDTVRASHDVRLLPPAVAPLPPGPLVHDSVVPPPDTARAGQARPNAAAPVLAGATVPRDTVPAGPMLVALGGIATDTTPADTDRVIVGRPIAGGTYKWFFLPGTVVESVGTDGDFTRIRLDERLDVFVAAADATQLPAGGDTPRRVASNARVVPAPDHVDLVIPMGARPAFYVEESGAALSLTLYGTRATTDIIAYRANDPFVRTVEWVQETNDRARYTVHLRDRSFGYLVLWERGSLVLRMRRAPVVDAARPLRGIVVAVDPGHPPIGATGPTGLWEPQATLWIAERVQRLLRERGAIPVMTRTSMEPVALIDRPVIARRANAHVLVSIHLNALPDGINPFRAHGTGTYFFRAQAEPLARAVQRGMVARMRLPNLGVYYDNLALTRPTWMPAILCEGAFLMLPDQEAGLRTARFQEAYARGIVDGLEEYFRSLAGDAR